MDIYARVVDDKIVEYPVFDIHIQNRAHPFDWYTKVKFDEKPEVPKFHNLREVVKCKDGVVTVSYTIVADSLNNLLRSIYPRNDRRSDEQTVIDIATLDPELVSRIVVLTKEFVQSLLDTFVQTHEYDNVVSVVSYKDSSVTQWAADAQRVITLRDQTWTALIEYLTDVQTGVEPIPRNSEAIKAKMPSLTWE